ncbi:MAG: mechanosensitive ion channel family protein [Deltaproteobacteria bacterium]|nr:mechanosensitive ion channel family protein [Deltaproteobacteria bacterium]
MIGAALALVAFAAGLPDGGLADGGVADRGRADGGVHVVDGGLAAVAPDAHSTADAGTMADASATPDAGAALATGAPAATPAPVAAAVAARVKERDSPLAFRVAYAGKDARRRALEAGDALEAALSEVPADGVAPLEIVLNGEVALVRVCGRAVATLTPADAAAEGAPDLAHYTEELEGRLLPFVQAELRRSSAQSIALSVFLFVAFGLLGVLTLRAARKAFDRLEGMVEQRRGALQPLTLLSIPLISGETLRGALLVGLFIGRILGYLVVTAVALGAALSQFEVTRPWLGTIATALLRPLVAGVDAGARAVPGLLLATLLVVLTAAGLRFARLWLDSVAQGRVEARMVRPVRVPATRVVVTAAALLVVAPLVVAAAFGRFGTPLETLAVAGGAAVLLAFVPVLASAAVGVVVLWRGALKPGDWIEVGDRHGEIASLSVLDVVLVPETGGTVVVPMLLLALRPVARTAAPRVAVVVRLKRDRPWTDLEPRLLALARAVEAGASVALLEAGERSVSCELSVPVGKPAARSALLTQVVQAAERGELTLFEPA